MNRTNTGGALELENAKRVGGRLCLDFVNTVKGRIEIEDARRGGTRSGHIVGERVVSYQALVRWGALGGALTERDARKMTREASVRPVQAAAVLTRSVASREAIYRIFKAAIEQRRPALQDLAALNSELRIARGHEQLLASPQFAWQWETDSLSLDRILWPIVRSAADLLTAADLSRVRQCPGEECGWLFLDISRSRRRQWCDMAECGNLAKVRRFRDRQRRST
jgi:predicted RNA-binding Zn ribbon-like protein